MGDVLFSMAEVNLHTELLVNVFCYVLGTIDGTVATTCAAKGDLHIGETTLLETGDVEIDEVIDTIEEGENFAIRFEEVDDGLVESSEWLVFVVASRIVGTSTVEYVTTTITCLVFGDSLFEGEREDADNQRRPSLSYGHLPLYGERAMRNVCLVILQIGFHFGFLGRIIRPNLFLVGI